MDGRLTCSQKRNIRRTTSKKRENERKGKHVPKYAVGDTVMVEVHDSDDYLMESYNWEYKGYIVKIYTHLNGLYIHYIIRAETPISTNNHWCEVDSKHLPEAKENCTFSRKRYGEKKFLEIIAYKSDTNVERAAEEAEDFLDYTNVMEDNMRNTFTRVFPSSKYRPTLRECLYNFWFVENQSAVGYSTLVTDPNVRAAFTKRFRYVSEVLRVYDLKITTRSKNIKNVACTLVPDFIQRPDVQYPFVDGFEEFEYVNTPFTYSNYSVSMTNEPVLIQLKNSHDDYDIEFTEIKNWRVIPQELYDIYILVSTTRDRQPQQSGCILDKYLNYEYKELPEDIKKICSNLMWPRDRIFDVKTTRDGYRKYHELVEVDSM